MRIRESWDSQRASLQEELTYFLRFFFACLAPCDLLGHSSSRTARLPAVAHACWHGSSESRTLAIMLRGELVHGTRLAAGANLLDARCTSEEAWLARSLLQLIATVLLANDDARASGVATLGGGRAGGEQSLPTSMGGQSAQWVPAAKRARDADTDALHESLLHALRGANAKGRADDRPRYLLLLGTVCDQRHGWPAAEPRAALIKALLLLLPAAGALPHWPTLPLVTWCLFRLAAAAPIGADDVAWHEAWLRLAALATILMPAVHVACAPDIAMSVAAGPSDGGVADGARASLRPPLISAHFCFRCLEIILERRLLPSPNREAALLSALTAAPKWLGAPADEAVSAFSILPLDEGEGRHSASVNAKGQQPSAVLSAALSLGASLVGAVPSLCHERDVAYSSETAGVLSHDKTRWHDVFEHDDSDDCDEELQRALPVVSVGAGDPTGAKTPGESSVGTALNEGNSHVDRQTSLSAHAVLVEALVASAAAAELVVPALDSIHPAKGAKQLATIESRLSLGDGAVGRDRNSTPFDYCSRSWLRVTAVLRAVGGPQYCNDEVLTADLSIQNLLPQADATAIASLEALSPGAETSSDRAAMDALGVFLPPRLAQLERCVEQLEWLTAAPPIGILDDANGVHAARRSVPHRRPELSIVGFGLVCASSDDQCVPEPPVGPPGVTLHEDGSRLLMKSCQWLLPVALGAIDAQGERLRRRIATGTADGPPELACLCQAARLACIRACLLLKTLRSTRDGSAKLMAARAEGISKQVQGLSKSLRSVAQLLRTTLAAPSTTARLSVEEPAVAWHCRIAHPLEDVVILLRALVELAEAGSHLVPNCNDNLDDNPRRWLEDILTPISPELPTFLHGVKDLLAAAVEQAERLVERRTLARNTEIATAREAASAAATASRNAAATSTAATQGGSGGHRLALDFGDGMELDEGDFRAVVERAGASATAVGTTKPMGGAGSTVAEPSGNGNNSVSANASDGLLVLLECMRLWFALQPRTAARLTHEAVAALRPVVELSASKTALRAHADAMRLAAMRCLAMLIAARRMVEAKRPSASGGAERSFDAMPTSCGPLITLWEQLNCTRLDEARAAIGARRGEGDGLLCEAMRAATAFARASPAVLPDGGSPRELTPYMRLVRAAADACAKVGGHVPPAGVRLPLEPRTRVVLANMLLEHLRMRVRMREIAKTKSMAGEEVDDGWDSTTDIADGDDGSGALLDALRDAHWAVCA